MLHIYTNENLISKPYMYDIEAEFSLLVPQLSTLFLDTDSVKILRVLEGMEERDGEIITSKFGKVLLTDISTGCEGVLLCNLEQSKSVINTDELGYNAIELLFDLSITREIYIVAHRVFRYIPEAFTATVDDEICTGQEIRYTMADNLGEGVSDVQ